ncbi:alpha/beta fold hydrolase [Rhodococcoides fascians]|uniref:alpha/beta fold hydrolase n=1 Tax=Rhodococcoides fascians TaxID=1828 RepID=UPI0009B8A74A|nr:alpha/beta hydrolase [Rhodococcus fascians]
MTRPTAPDGPHRPSPRWPTVRNAVAPLLSDSRSVAAMFSPLRTTPQLDAPSLPWTEITQVDLGHRGQLTVRHTPNIAASDTIPVVLLHGITLNADVNFFALADLFGPTRPVIVFDLPNHGRGIRLDHFTFEDVADDVIAVLDRLGVQEATLCGYSLGGIVSMVTADRHPDRAAGLIVQAAAMRYGVGIRERVFLHAVAAAHKLGLDQATRGLPARYWRASARTSKHAAARQLWVEQQLTVSGKPRYATVWRAVQRNDHRVLRSSAPTAVLVLTADRVCPPVLQNEAAELLGAHVFRVDADHDVPVADPAKFARATEKALRWVDSQRRDRSPLPRC